MMPLIRRVLRGTCFLLFAVFTSYSSAQTAPMASLEVSDVKVNYVNRPPQGKWIEVDVELSVRASGPSQRFVNKPKVTLSLGVEVSAPPKRMDFYKAVASAVTLEEGKKANFRFYLPPEVVSRDSLTLADVKWYAVELGVGGNALKMSTKNITPNLASPEAYNGFKTKVSSDSVGNDGVLLPQYLTIFAFDTAKPAPSFIRVESTRDK